MTEAGVGVAVGVVLAVLFGLVKVLDFVNKSVMPQLQTLRENVATFHTVSAMNTQQIEQQTARLNGQSAKIDTLLIHMPPSRPAAAVNVNAAPPSDVVINAPAPVAAPPEAAPAPEEETPAPMEDVPAPDAPAKEVTLIGAPANTVYQLVPPGNDAVPQQSE